MKRCLILSLVRGQNFFDKATGEERTVVQESLWVEVLVEYVNAVRDHFYLVFSEEVNEDYSVTGNKEIRSQAPVGDSLKKIALPMSLQAKSAVY